MRYSNEFKMNGSVFPYNALISEDDYLYEISVICKNKDATIIITKHGVSLFYNNGGSITSNITPCGIFPNKSKLSGDDLKYILTIWQNNGYEGKYYSEKEMDAFYDQFISGE